jgi:uncharacterized protein YqjF (DUF2071 family)
MNPPATKLITAGPAARPSRPDSAPPTWFIADWRDMLFVHYRVPPAALQPHVPYPLDLHEGSAWVSLVFFRLEKMRPPGLGAFGRALMRPISDHAFLNVRTYVRGPAGPGIHFLAEWIPNRISSWIGPLTYGLPYRLGGFDYDVAGKGTGVGRIAINDAALGAGCSLTFPVRPVELCGAPPDSSEEFLLEKYTAYTHRAGVSRYLRVAHEPWMFHAVDWMRTDTTLIERAFPWFADARFHSAHRTPGVRGVRMSRPVRLGARAAHSPADRTLRYA